MDAETRAALEWAIERAGIDTDNPIWLLNLMDERRARLQALLDGEKGGGAAQGEPVRSLEPSGLPVAGAASTAPPDSAAKMLAEDIESAARGLDHIAARVEALGLEPSERERMELVLRRATDERVAGLLLNLGRQGFTAFRCDDLALWASWLKSPDAALTPIAERKP